LLLDPKREKHLSASYSPSHRSKVSLGALKYKNRSRAAVSTLLIPYQGSAISDWSTLSLVLVFVVSHTEINRHAS